MNDNPSPNQEYPLVDDPRPWAFTRAELAAGLRRQTGDPTLQITLLREREITQRLPAVGRLRGIKVTAEGVTGKYDFDLVVKEPSGSTRAGAAGAGLREASMYLTLKEHIPVRMPVLVAAHPKGRWLILKHLPPGRRPEKWQAADYLLAIDQLAVLHDRFWGLAQDLSIYPWLDYPLQSGLSIYVKAAKADARHLTEPVSKMLAEDTDISYLTNQIIDHLQTIVANLSSRPGTLLHGDYWPGNIHIHPNSGLTVFDWEDAAIGPAVFDLLGFIQGSIWQFGKLPLPPEEIITHYRSRLAQTGSHVYTDDDWAEMWDNALMWTFVTGWVNILSRVPDALLTTRLAAIEAVLFQPLKEAVQRRLS
jgi:hypothetical protein